MTGHLGNVIIRMLLKQKQEVVGLLYPGEKNLFPQIKTVQGDVCEKETLVPLFESHENVIVIHCAGCVSIRSDEGLKLWSTNVVGTRNMVDLAMQYHVEKFIYVSSVHAIPERKDNQEMVETDKFDSRYVVGDYAKTKATATQYVFILSGRYYSVKELFNTLSEVSGKRKIRIYLSTELVSKIAPIAEKIFLKLHLKPSVTPYSVYTLSTNANFSTKKAKEELGLRIRPIENTLIDTVRWIKKTYN